MALGIALDLGTSGYRTHLVDLDREAKILSTAITMRHPLPGANVMDHLHFWIENGSDIGHKVIVETVDKLIRMHDVEPKDIAKLSVSGNPIQLSMFENIEIRDLAYAGQHMLDRLKVKRPERKGHITTAGEIGLISLKTETEVLIPPAIRHEIGADALAMIMKSGLLEKDETCMVTDYGTNAEMGLFHDGELYSGSAAAGPAMEGQHITHGMLASPHAISDLEIADDGRWYNLVLDQSLKAVRTALVDPATGEFTKVSDLTARGITGTGVVAAVALGLETGLIKLPDVDTSDHNMHFTNDILFSELDMREAGKAMGAIRAGHRTLIHEVGIKDEDVKTMYMAGASGTYVDPIKAQMVGMVPRILDTVVQVGNTSLMMAHDLLKDPETLDHMQDVANSIASKHIMFATSKIFEDLYVNEISYWLEGMPMELYNAMLEGAGLDPLPPLQRPKKAYRMVASDIPVIGDRGLRTLNDVGVYLVGEFEGCTGCGVCVRGCPEQALSLEKLGDKRFRLRVSTDKCLGTACKNCEMKCPQGVFNFSELVVEERR